MTHTPAPPPPPTTLLVEERAHRLGEGTTTHALDALDDTRLWWCVRRPDGRFDTWIVGPGGSPRLVCAGETQPTEDAARLSGGALALAVHPELRLFDGETLTPAPSLTLDGDWPARRLIPLPRDRLVPMASQESVPVWDVARREVVGVIDARTMGLLSFGARGEDADAVLVAGGEPGPPWQGTLWDVIRGEALRRVRVPPPEGGVLESSEVAVRPGTDELFALLTHRQGEVFVTSLHRWAAGQHTVLDERRGPAPVFTELMFVAPGWLMVMGHRADALWALDTLTVRHGLRVTQVTPSGRARLPPRAVLDLHTGERARVPGDKGDPWCLHPLGDRVTVAAGPSLTTWRLPG